MACIMPAIPDARPTQKPHFARALSSTVTLIGFDGGTGWLKTTVFPDGWRRSTGFASSCFKRIRTRNFPDQWPAACLHPNNKPYAQLPHALRLVLLTLHLTGQVNPRSRARGTNTHPISSVPERR